MGLRCRAVASSECAAERWQTTRCYLNGRQFRSRLSSIKGRRPCRRWRELLVLSWCLALLRPIRGSFHLFVVYRRMLSTVSRLTMLVIRLVYVHGLACWNFLQVRMTQVHAAI